MGRSRCLGCGLKYEKRLIVRSRRENPVAWLRRASVPRRFLSATVDDLTADQRDAIGPPGGLPVGDDGRPRGLFIYGAVGTGKTHALAAFLRERVIAGADVHWADWRDLLASVRASYGEPGASEGHVLSGPFSVEVLVIDDVGVVMSEHATRIADHLLRKRYNAQLETHVTSNLSLSDIATQADARIASVLRGLCLPIQWGGVDRRLA